MLRNLYERLTYLRNLEERKETVLNSIEEQGKLTDELKAQILAAETMVAVEDLYRPYKPKRRTRATIAKERGLEPLANVITLQMLNTPLEAEATKFINPEKKSIPQRMRLPEQKILSPRQFQMRRITARESVTLP